MGVINITPDSFSDGGQLLGAKGPDLDSVHRRAESMFAAGATLLDVGGESTRPGALAISVQQELDRVMPVIEMLCREFDVVVSVDTSTPEVMLAGARLGAGLINDVRALRRDGALDAARDSGLPVCLVHMRGEPDTMQEAPTYGSVVEEVKDFLLARTRACMDAGIPESRLLLDPGFGFGKTSTHNLALLAQLDVLVACGYPLLVGLSRKSMIGQLLGRAVDQRLAGGLALAALAVYKGASIVRSHDVAPTLDAIRMAAAVRTGGRTL